MAIPASGSRGERLQRARAVLHWTTQRLHDTPTHRRVDAVPGAEVFAVADALVGLFADRGLRRGSIVRVGPSTALLLALLAEASSRGHWCAIVGALELGLVAAAEAGLDLGRLALIPDPGDQLVAVTSALVDGIDLIALAGTQRLRPADRHRLAARARQRGAVLLPTGPWPGADLHLRLIAGPGGWRGLSHDGHGRLRSRHVHIQASGRHLTHPRTISLLLPGATGTAVAAPPTGSSTPTRPAKRPGEHRAG